MKLFPTNTYIGIQEHLLMGLLEIEKHCISPLLTVYIKYIKYASIQIVSQNCIL